MKRVLVLALVAMLVLIILPASHFSIFAAEKDAQAEKADEKAVMVRRMKETPQKIQKEIDGMVRRLDNAGQIVGIGVKFELFELNGKTLPAIYSTIKGKPAEKAGIEENDLVLSVNGKPFTTSKEFMKEIRGDGKPGRAVVFELQRKDAKINITANTAVLRPDKTAEAEILQARIRKEGANLIAKFVSAAEAAVKVLEAANAAPLTSRVDSRITPVGQILDAYYQWADKQYAEIDELLAVK
ncbi:MAG: PDZ domain-containing protein [bacterium]|nr:PDZ domain-containing protein [bacterium]